MSKPLRTVGRTACPVTNKARAAAAEALRHGLPLRMSILPSHHTAAKGGHNPPCQGASTCRLTSCLRVPVTPVTDILEAQENTKEVESPPRCQGQCPGRSHRDSEREERVCEASEQQSPSPPPQAAQTLLPNRMLKSVFTQDPKFLGNN